VVVPVNVWREINTHVDAFVLGFMAGFAAAIIFAIAMM
jgi:hypothetical protein